MSFIIDVHHHILPDFFWRETNDGAHPVGGIAPPPWDQAGAARSRRADRGYDWRYRRSREGWVRPLHRIVGDGERYLSSFDSRTE